MKRWFIILSISILIIILLIPNCYAHVPVEPGENDSLDHALHIDDPKKSWAIYDELDCICAIRYYKFDLKTGDRLRISIFTPDEKGFAPNLVIMSPGNFQNDTLPYFVEKPVGYGIRLVSGNRPDNAGYEPFTPSSHYQIVDFDETVNITGTYYLAVFDADASGRFGIAIGYSESFTIEEWVMVPFDVVNIRLWEGQDFGTILLPIIITLIIGIELLYWRKYKQKKPPKTSNGIIGSIAAFIFIGSGAMLLFQMIFALSKWPTGSAGAIITFIFGFVPILLGLLILRFWFSEKKYLSIFDRIKFIIFGLIGLFIWAGYFIGPILLIISSLLPMKKDEKSNQDNY